MHGQFVWYELTTPDVEAAKKFYPQFTGWGTQQYDKDYTMFTQGGAPIAGIFQLNAQMRAQGIPPNWMPYIEAGDVDHTAKQAATLGGKIVVAPQDIPGTGRFAVISDPQGAVFGIYKSTAKSMSWDGTPVIGRFSWHELMATDYHKAFDFYRKLFNWEKMQEMDMGGGMMYFIFGSKGKMYGGMFNRMADMASMNPFWMNYIFVKDVPKAVDVAKRAGGQLHRGPMDIPGGVIAILGDTTGAGFALHAATAPVEAPKPASTKTAATATRATAKVSSKGSSNGSRPAAKTTTKKATKKTAAKKPAATKRAAKKKTAKTKKVLARRAPAKKSAGKKAATRSKAGRR